MAFRYSMRAFVRTGMCPKDLEAARVYGVWARAAAVVGDAQSFSAALELIEQTPASASEIEALREFWEARGGGLH